MIRTLFARRQPPPPTGPATASPAAPGATGEPDATEPALPEAGALLLAEFRWTLPFDIVTRELHQRTDRCAASLASTRLHLESFERTLDQLERVAGEESLT